MSDRDRDQRVAEAVRWSARTGAEITALGRQFAAALCNPSLHPERIVAWGAVVLPPMGATLILLAFHHAAELPVPDQWQFVMYWAGLLCAMAPLVVLACSPGINGVLRACSLTGIGMFGMVPRLLRLPFGPIGYDEFAHLRQMIETYTDGDVGVVSQLLPISQHFPGLHQAVSAFAWLTGASLWSPALAVIVMAHVLSVLAVYQLIRGVGGSAGGAAAGTVIYTLNPSWLYFHTSVAYESLALPLLLWCLAAAVAASCALHQPNWRNAVVILLAAAALPTIHHLSTIILCLIITLLIVAGLVHRFRRNSENRGAPREYLWPLLLSLFSLLASITFWWSDIYEWLVAYLSPALTRGWTQLKQLLESTGTAAKPAGKRTLFGGALNPIYETLCGYLYPAVVLMLFATALAVLWRQRRRFGSAPWGFAALGAMYFLSIPMVLTKGGAEGAHRSWAFSFVGIAVVCGLAWSHRPSWAEVSRIRLFRPCAAHLGPSGVKVGGAGLVGLTLIVMYIGSAALGTNVSARFPGSAHAGDDARSVSKEAAAVGVWMAAHEPIDTPVVADRYVSEQLGSTARLAPLSPSDTFPLWDLFMSARPVRPEVLKQVLDANVRYFVVDARMMTSRPRMGYWFTGDEPGAGGTDLFPQSAIDRFNCLPWLRAVYAAGPLTVYKVDRDSLRRTAAGSCWGSAA